MSTYTEPDNLFFPNCYWVSGTPGLLLSQYFESRQIQYIGGPAESHLSLNRLHFKEYLKSHHFPTPEFIPLSEANEGNIKQLARPWVVKTPYDANSAGIYTATDFFDIVKLRRQLPSDSIVEAWSKSREFTIAFFGDASNRQILVSEILISGIFDQEEKKKSMGRFCERINDTQLESRLINFARKFLDIHPLHDFGRLDVLLDYSDDSLKVIDINFLPGLKPFNPPSLFHATLDIHKYDHHDAIFKMIESAWARQKTLVAESDGNRSSLRR